MLKLALLVLLASFACRHWTGHWPWVLWRRLSAPPAGERARLLLGLPRGAGRDEIIAAHRRLIAQVHPDRGGSPALVHEANDARDLLLARLPSDA